MTIFVVFRVQDPVRMKAAIEQAYPNDHFDLGNNEWLVSDRGVAKAVSDKIGITAEPVGATTRSGNAIVFSMENYFGRAQTNIWEWIKAKSEATDG